METFIAWIERTLTTWFSEQIRAGRLSSSLLREDGTLVAPPQLGFPSLPAHGDLTSNIAMQTWKKELAGTWPSPRALAEELTNALQTQAQTEHYGIAKVEVAGGGFINFWIEPQALWQWCAQAEKGQSIFGENSPHKGKIWEIEHTSPNPNKAMHIGHLRNNVTAMAIANLWESQGATIIREAVDNNRGISLAKVMWGFLKFARKDGQQTTWTPQQWLDHPEEWLSPTDTNERPDRFIDRLYVLGSGDGDDHPESNTIIRQLVRDWEAGDAANRALWRHVLDFSLAGQNMTLTRLGNRWDYVWHEDEHYQQGKDIVDAGLQKGIFQKLEDGAILTKLEEFGLTDTIVQKADGTALYITQDLALTKLKQEKHHADHYTWVIGPEQSLALKQMFAVCEQLGFGSRDHFTHLAYGFMSIKGSGKMSSRAGNAVYIDDLLDLAREAVLEKIDQERWPNAEDRLKLAEEIAVSAVKYSILKVERNTSIAFDFATSLTFEGDSGPYLQYMHARCCSVLEKAGTNTPSAVIDNAYAWEPSELELVRWLVRFPLVVRQAATNNAPNTLCQYLFTLAQNFSGFYTNCGIAVAPEPQRSARVQLTKATQVVLKAGLELLGMTTPERL